MASPMICVETAETAESGVAFIPVDRIVWFKAKAGEGRVSTTSFTIRLANGEDLACSGNVTEAVNQYHERLDGSAPPFSRVAPDSPA